MKPKTISMVSVGSAPAASGAPTPGLLLLHPLGATSGVHPLDEVLTTVGREAPAGLVIQSSLVSAEHAALTWDGTTLGLEDFGSRNGTLVNGRRIRTAALADGDSVRFGDVTFKVVMEGIRDHLGYGLDGSRAGDPPGGAMDRVLSRTVGGFRLHAALSRMEAAASHDVTVLLLGETGAGKEIFARHYHARSGRKGKLVPINCGAISPHLVEAELFGARKGSYSGAHQDRPGAFRVAHEGTLFLDELGDMPLEAQTRLLRVLQDRVVVPVGESIGTPVDVRIVAATHRDLHAMVAARAFREDLYQRIKEVVVELPPLRARKEDLLPLCQAFLVQLGRPEMRIGPSFMAGLVENPFPGNVRELEALVKQGVALAGAGAAELTDKHLPDEVRDALDGHGTSTFTWGRRAAKRTTRDPEEPVASLAAPPSLEPVPSALEGDDTPPKDVMLWMVRHHRGNVSALARAFDRSRAWVQRVATQYQIDLGRRR